MGKGSLRIRLKEVLKKHDKSERQLANKLKELGLGTIVPKSTLNAWSNNLYSPANVDKMIAVIEALRELTGNEKLDLCDVFTLLPEETETAPPLENATTVVIPETEISSPHRSGGWLKPILFVLLGAAVAGVPTYLILTSQYSNLTKNLNTDLETLRAQIATLETESQNPIATPVILAPTDVVATLTPTLQVQVIPEVDEYSFSLKNERSNMPVYQVDVQGNAVTIPEGILCPSVPYMWNVVASRGDKDSDPSIAEVFETRIANATAEDIAAGLETTQPSTPVLLAPLGTEEAPAIVQTLNPTLRVEADLLALSYGFYIRDLVKNEVVYDNDLVASNSVTLPNGIIEPGRKYRWNAQARNCAGPSPFSERSYFNVGE